jgi:hypothetical protein
VTLRADTRSRQRVAVAGDVTIDSTRANVTEVASLIRAALANQRNPRGASGRPPFVEVDSVQIPVPDLDAALAFYRDALGHALIWRTDSAPICQRMPHRTVG